MNVGMLAEKLHKGQHRKSYKGCQIAKGPCDFFKNTFPGPWLAFDRVFFYVTRLPHLFASPDICWRRNLQVKTKQNKQNTSRNTRKWDPGCWYPFQYEDRWGKSYTINQKDKEKKQYSLPFIYNTGMWSRSLSWFMTCYEVNNRWSDHEVLLWTIWNIQWFLHQFPCPAENPQPFH